MTPWARFPPVLLLAVVLHTAVLPHFRAFGVTADILLLLGVTAGIVGGPERGAVIGFMAGLCADLFVQTPFGLSALAYSLTGYAVGTLQSTILRAAWWIPLATTFVACALGVLAFAFAGAVVGESHLVNGHLPTVMAVVATFGVALSLVVVRLVRWALADAELARIGLR